MKIWHGSQWNAVFTDHLLAATEQLEILDQNANIKYDQNKTRRSGKRQFVRHIEM